MIGDDELLDAMVEASVTMVRAWLALGEPERALREWGLALERQARVVGIGDVHVAVAA